MEKQGGCGSYAHRRPADRTVDVGGTDFVPEHFASVDAICAYLRSRAGKARARARGPAMAEAATKAAAPPRRRQLGRASRPGTAPVARLLRGADGAAYWLAVAPLAARLPASLAYRVACWRAGALPAAPLPASRQRRPRRAAAAPREPSPAD